MIYYLFLMLFPLAGVAVVLRLHFEAKLDETAEENAELRAELNAAEERADQYETAWLNALTVPREPLPVLPIEPKLRRRVEKPSRAGRR